MSDERDLERFKKAGEQLDRRNRVRKDSEMDKRNQKINELFKQGATAKDLKSGKLDKYL